MSCPLEGSSWTSEFVVPTMHAPVPKVAHIPET
jgi:hypothetical protein